MSSQYASVRCIRCGSPAEGLAQFCANCIEQRRAQEEELSGRLTQSAGERDAAQSVNSSLCPSCGRYVSPGANFCGYCRHQLAGVGGSRSVVWNRIAAILIDAVVLLFLAAPFMDFGSETRIQNGQAIKTYGFFLSGPETLVWTIVFFAYFVVMEWLFAATIGKLAVGIRVTRQDGHVASLPAVLVRNVMRLVDAFPYLIPYLVGFVAMGGNQGRQRLGDRVAGTIVVPKEALSREGEAFS